MSCRIASLLILLVAKEVLLAQQPYAQAVPAVQVQPPEDKAKHIAPEKVLRMLGADGKTAYDATYVGAFRFLDQNRTISPGRNTSSMVVTGARRFVGRSSALPTRTRTGISRLPSTGKTGT